MALRQLERGLRLGRAGARHDQARDAYAARARQYLVEVVHEARVREVGADVDQIHVPNLRSRLQKRNRPLRSGP
jgi:hypothetical protein